MVKKISFLFIWATFFLFFSCNNSKAIENERNLKRVKIQMKVQQVEEIMGKPDTVLPVFKRPDLFEYKYESPIGMSDDFYIFFSKGDSVVTGINNGL